MGCGCKQDNKFKIPEGNKAPEARMMVHGDTVLKWTIFILLTILAPIYAPIIVIYVLYKAIIRTERLDAVLMLKSLSRAARDIVTEEEREQERLRDELEELEDLKDFEVVELEPAA